MTDTTPSTSSTPFHFPGPTPTASLLLSHRPPAGKIALVLGTSKLAASRCFACLEAGIRPVVIDVEAPGRNQGKEICAELKHRIARGQVARHSIAHALFHSKASVETTFSGILDSFDGDNNAIFAVCVTDTLHSGDDDTTPTAKAANIDADNGDDSIATEVALTSYARAQIISKLCRRRRIPVNVADKPELCDFSFPAHYRFPCTTQPTGSASSLQIAVTTNGRGCRLAGRIRREIVSALPHNVGDAVESVGVMRDLAKRRSEPPSHKAKRGRKNGTAEMEEEDLSFDTTPLNSPVPQLTPHNPLEKASVKLRQLQAKREEAEERTKRRMRWVAQISEYWPIEYLGNLDEGAMEEALRAHGEADPTSPTSEKRTLSVEPSRGRAVARSNDDDVATAAGGATSVAHRARSQHSLDIRPPMPVSRRGHIYLLGSGPGHPGLLTTFAYRLLTSPTTSLILSDKLVPSSILSLIPRSTPLEIAKKFPGNAEGAQSELIAKALRAALEEGKTVVRLKQGDPFVYGRGGEEVLAFRNAGIECTVVPGISSCVAAPAMLGIPVTQRGAADSLVLCTGVGKGGKKVKLPGYERGRSLVVLMGVARLRVVVATLTDGAPQTVGAVEGDSIGDRDGAVFPPYTPIAIIERASSPDQRLVASTLEGIVEALEGCGEQRPPGMMLIGWSVLALEGRGDVTIQDDGMAYEGEDLEKRDRERVAAWLKGRRWIVREGLDQAYREAGAALQKSPLQFPLDTTPLVHHAENSGKERFSERDGAGWAPPRYATGVPEGGWMEGEAPNRPATDQIKYEQDRTYAEVQARLCE